jgi:Fe-S cluster biogenesis protein NfuA
MPEGQNGQNTAAEIRPQVQEVIDEIRGLIQNDGGDIELVDIDAECNVFVRLHGACVGCPRSQMTLSLGVERRLKQKVPAVKSVAAV